MSNQNPKDILGGPLPPELGGPASLHDAIQDGKAAIVDFLKSNVPPCDHKEIDEELKKPFPLDKQKNKKLKQAQPKRKGKYLTARERRDLNLAKIPRQGLKYEDFKELHNLWKGYIREVLGLDQIRDDNDKSRVNDGHFPVVLEEQLQLRVCRSDFHGALMKVTKSLNSSLLGAQGIVIMETKNALRLIDKKNVVSTIPKAGCSFTFAIDGYVMTLEGSAMCVRPSERAVKKWKNKPIFNF